MKSNRKIHEIQCLIAARKMQSTWSKLKIQAKTQQAPKYRLNICQVFRQSRWILSLKYLSLPADDIVI